MNDMALGRIMSQSLFRNEHFAVPVPHPPVSLSKNLNRLLSAAVVSPRFRSLLLSNPAAALATGYNGESFQLTQTEYAAVMSLRASTISDFAAQLLRIFQHASEDAAHYAPNSQRDYQFAEVAAQSSFRSR
jgi:hypothetical protein